MSIKILIVLLGCLLSFPKTLLAQTDNETTDTLRMSLLTCAPGDISYELFGHTAVRVENLKTGQDLVFNYGIIDFDRPNFVLRFILGETDYSIGVTYFSSFANSYQRHGRYVIEQVLNLKPTEKVKLLEALMADAMIPGWTYRYNILYDNCATRAVQQIRKAVDGQIVLPKIESGRRTFRDILHEFTSEVSPWNSFGNDLLLGSEVDQPIDVWKQTFSPIYAERLFDAAYIVEPNGIRRALVAKKEMAVQVITDVAEPFFITPMMAAVLLLVLTLGASVWELSKKRMLYRIDYFWMTVQGTAGCIIAFLFFFSVHPAVGTNWLIVWLNPLPLVYLPIKVWRDRKHRKDYYYPALAVALAVFFVAVLFNVQDFPHEIYVVALILLLRMITSFYLERKTR